MATTVLNSTVNMSTLPTLPNHLPITPMSSNARQSMWTLNRAGLPPMTMLEQYILRNKFNVQNDRYTHLKMNGGKFYLPMDRRNEFFNICAADVASGNINFVVEMPFDPEAAKGHAMRLVMDLDVDSVLGEVGDDEWKVLVDSILSTVHEVYPHLSAYERRIILLNAGSKPRRKDGRDCVKTGRHCVFPNIYVTQRIALQLRELIILRIQETQALSECASLRAELVSNLIDKCIYENGTAGKMNGMRMPEMHKAHGCSHCKRRRFTKQREVLQEWHAAGSIEPKPKDKFWRFDDCERCFGRSFIYEGRPYSVHLVFDGNGDILRDDLDKFKSSLVTLYEQTCVRIADDALPTKCQDILEHLTAIPRDDAAKKRRKKHRVANNANNGNILNARAADNWILQSRNSEACSALDRFLFVNFRHASYDDKSIPEMMRVDPHGISTWKRSVDGKKYIATSISTYCLNKAAHDEPTHNRSQVYFIISDDGSVVQRCHADKTYGGILCKKFRSRPAWLDETTKLLLWPLDASAADNDIAAESNDVVLGAFEPKSAFEYVQAVPGIRLGWRVRIRFFLDASANVVAAGDEAEEDNSEFA